MDNGDVVYSGECSLSSRFLGTHAESCSFCPVLAGLRDLEGFDDEAWDGSAEPSDRGSFNGSAVSSVDEPVQLTFRGQRSATSGLDVQATRRNPFKTSAHSLIRPETKVSLGVKLFQSSFGTDSDVHPQVFYSSSQQVAELIAEISKGHDQGSE